MSDDEIAERMDNLNWEELQELKALGILIDCSPAFEERCRRNTELGEVGIRPALKGGGSFTGSGFHP